MKEYIFIGQYSIIHQVLELSRLKLFDSDIKITIYAVKHFTEDAHNKVSNIMKWGQKSFETPLSIECSDTIQSLKLDEYLTFKNVVDVISEHKKLLKNYNFSVVEANSIIKIKSEGSIKITYTDRYNTQNTEIHLENSIIFNSDVIPNEHTVESYRGFTNAEFLLRRDLSKDKHLKIVFGGGPTALWVKEICKNSAILFETRLAVIGFENLKSNPRNSNTVSSVKLTDGIITNRLFTAFDISNNQRIKQEKREIIQKIVEQTLGEINIDSKLVSVIVNENYDIVCVCIKPSIFNQLKSKEEYRDHINKLTELLDHFNEYIKTVYTIKSGISIFSCEGNEELKDKINLFLSNTKLQSENIAVVLNHNSEIVLIGEGINAIGYQPNLAIIDNSVPPGQIVNLHIDPRREVAEYSIAPQETLGSVLHRLDYQRMILAHFFANQGKPWSLETIMTLMPFERLFFRIAESIHIMQGNKIYISSHKKIFKAYIESLKVNIENNQMDEFFNNLIREVKGMGEGPRTYKESLRVIENCLNGILEKELVYKIASKLNNILISKRLLCKNINFTYKNSILSEEEYKNLLELLKKRINYYSNISKKVKHGIHAGEFPRDWREMNADLQAIKNFECPIDVGLERIRQRSINIGKNHPIASIWNNDASTEINEGLEDFPYGKSENSEDLKIDLINKSIQYIEKKEKLPTLEKGNPILSQFKMEQEKNVNESQEDIEMNYAIKLSKKDFSK